MKATRTRPAIKVSADGVGVVSHVGSRLLADLADRSTLAAELSEVSAGPVAPCDTKSGHRTPLTAPETRGIVAPARCPFRQVELNLEKSDSSVL